MNLMKELSMLYSTRGATAGVIGAGLVAGAIMIGSAGEAAASTAVVPDRPGVENVVAMGGHTMTLPRGWHPHHWGHWKHWWWW
jgi:hypothetical protein